jgi:cell division septation protein DedD
MARARPSPVLGLRKLVTAVVLVAIGGTVGLVVGSVSNVPELLLAWLSRERTTVSLGAPAPSVAGESPAPEHTDLREFPGLQVPAPSAPPPAVAAPPPAPAEVRPRVAPAPAPTPAASAPAVIAALERKRAAASPEPVVQVASYTDPRSAEALVQRLRRMGFDAYKSKTSTAAGDRFRVRVRPAASEDPSRVASKLAGNGFSVWVTRE